MIECECSVVSPVKPVSPSLQKNKSDMTISMDVIWFKSHIYLNYLSGTCVLKWNVTMFPWLNIFDSIIAVIITIQTSCGTSSPLSHTSMSCGIMAIACRVLPMDVLNGIDRMYPLILNFWPRDNALMPQIFCTFGGMFIIWLILKLFHLNMNKFDNSPNQ